VRRHTYIDVYIHIKLMIIIEDRIQPLSTGHLSFLCAVPSF
jgi:hypothetical protein